MFSQKLKEDMSNFKIKLAKQNGVVRNNTTYMGIVDENDKKSLFSYEGAYYILYGDNCHLRYLETTQILTVGKGFEEGETVEVDLDIVKGSIEWRVGGEMRNRLVRRRLKTRASPGYLW